MRQPARKDQRRNPLELRSKPARSRPKRSEVKRSPLRRPQRSKSPEVHDEEGLRTSRARGGYPARSRNAYRSNGDLISDSAQARSAPESTVKLQKRLAEAGLGSRRAMEELIQSGEVRVNGKPARLGMRVGTEAMNEDVWKDVRSGHYPHFLKTTA